MNEGFQYRSRVGSDADGRSLLDHLVRSYPKVASGEWLRRIEAGRVLLDDAPARAETILRAGQSLVWMRPPWEEPHVPLSFAILYRSDHVIAVAKPSGLPTLPGGGSFVTHTLLSRVHTRFPGASPLHRLGRATSGIVLFATTAAAFADIAGQWRDGRVLKVYRALVSGWPAGPRFAVDAPIGPVAHAVLGTVHGVSLEGKPAHSDVEVVERREGCALVEVRIQTGRPHQIRIHLAASGHPLVGDPLYPIGGIPADDCRALPADGGYHLHAALLGFTDPSTGLWTEIACGAPPLLRAQAPRQPGFPQALRSN